MIIGLDVGGTHIDAVIVSRKKIIKTVKKPVSFKALEETILHVLDLLLENIDPLNIKQINLSTTIITNAIVLNQVNEVGLILQSGPGVNLSQFKTKNTVFLSGATDHRGIVVRDYDYAELEQAIELFKRNNIKDIAVATKFAIRNPETEQAIKSDLKNTFRHVTLSHTVSGLLNYPRRLTTAKLNASVHSQFSDFYARIVRSLKEKNVNAPIYILKADGGLLSLEAARKHPVQTILSGPAASLNGFLALFDLRQDAVSLDIGGTTTDIFIVADGDSLFEPLGATINGQKTLIRALYSKSIALGGDSQIKVSNGTLTIGPLRQGEPYALGGPVLTLTDAFIYLNRLQVGDKVRAKEAIGKVAQELRLTTKETALKIIEEFTLRLKQEVDLVVAEVNNKPVYTIKELLADKMIRPETINIIGGPAKLLERSIQQHFKLVTVYPKHFALANAIGAALSKVTAVVNVHADTSKGRLTVAELSLTDIISRDFTLSAAKRYAHTALETLTKSKLSSEDVEIVEESAFNMIDGFYTKGKNIRVKAQVKPGLIYKLVGEKDA
ncbi:MAG TPA: hydantoinase/oxoprolinase family protein [Bacilli bacterium]|nr:hydantoinase/oxoprolinase family protein [Bacilli bacterium]